MLEIAAITLDNVAEAVEGLHQKTLGPLSSCVPLVAEPCVEIDQLAVPNLPRKCDFRLAAPAGLLPGFTDVQCKRMSQGAD